MKKIIALLLALVMVLGLAGCTNGKPSAYKLGDIYAMSNVLREIPYAIGHWDSMKNKWIVSDVMLLNDVLSLEQSKRIIYNDDKLTYNNVPLAENLNGFEIDYYLRGKTISDLNAFVNIYHNALLKNEDVKDEYRWVGQSDGGIRYEMIMNPKGDEAGDTVYIVGIGASTYDGVSGKNGDAPYLYVWVTETTNETAYAWW